MLRWQPSRLSGLCNLLTGKSSFDLTNSLELFCRSSSISVSIVVQFSLGSYYSKLFHLFISSNLCCGFPNWKPNHISVITKGKLTPTDDLLVML